MLIVHLTIYLTIIYEVMFISTFIVYIYHFDIYIISIMSIFFNAKYVAILTTVAKNIVINIA